MKKLLFVVVILLALSLSANAYTVTYGARVATDTGGVLNFEAGVTGPGFAVSSTGCTAAGCGPQMSVYSSTSYADRYLEYVKTLPTTGYYEAFTAFGNVNQAVAKTDIKWAVTHAGGTTTVTQDQTNPNNKNNWMSVGTYKFLSTSNAVLKMTAGTVASGSMYNHSIQFRSATPGAVTNTGPANGATGEAMDFVDLGISWTAGLYNMAYDVWFGEDSNNMTKIMSAFAGTGLGLDPGGIEAGKTYFWRVDALNVDNVTQGETWSFTTNPIPEPGSMLALASGLVGLFGIIRRKRA